MPTFVLIAGGWRGGWSLTPLASKLRAMGHEVFTPTLTGLGERVHLASARPNLDTHIMDVANLPTFEDLNDVILCGHSYAGMVVSGVADRLPERIAALVYVDAFVPDDGQSWWDLAGDYFRKLAIDGSAADGFGVMPPPSAGDPRRVPHPLAP
jgi:pimeloyl-ACP methyl ester carboxylesterase